MDILYECNNGCGFISDYNTVEQHKKTCYFNKNTYCLDTTYLSNLFSALCCVIFSCY